MRPRRKILGAAVMRANHDWKMSDSAPLYALFILLGAAVLAIAIIGFVLGVI
jgi:hypothetical protein